MKQSLRLPLLFGVSLSGALAACGDNLTLPPERTPAQGSDTQELECIPDLDGIIQRDELAAAIAELDDQATRFVEQREAAEAKRAARRG